MRTVDDIIYDLSATDEVVWVNDAWSRCADANDGGALSPDLVLRRRLWDFIAGEPTRHIYGLLFDRVRSGGEVVRLSFRCDAPARRRLLELEISPLPDGYIRCRTRSVAEEARNPVALLDPARARSDQLLRLCSWCKRMAVPERGWLHLEVAVSALGLFADRLPPDLTHGVCPDCARILEEAVSDPPFGASGRAIMGPLDGSGA